MAAVLSWYFNKMSYFSYKEILESRTELFKLINGDVFYSFPPLQFLTSMSNTVNWILSEKENFHWTDMFYLANREIFG